MKGYDYFLVYTKLGTDRKFRRLTIPERWCAVFGVWATAAESPTRGCLLITESERATESDYAEQAGVTLAVAKSTVRKMRDLGMLEHDGDVEWVHDWDAVQPAPKPSDAPEATRERKRRSRANQHAGHADVTRDTVPGSRGCHESPPYPPFKGKGRKDPPYPPRGKRARDIESWRLEMAEWVAAHPVTDELREQWAALATERLTDLVDEGTSAMYLDSLHLHAAGEALILGAPARTAAYVAERFGRVLAEAAGCPVQIIDCGCPLAAGTRTRGVLA